MTNIQVIAKVKGKPDVQLVNQEFTADVDVELVKILDGAAASMYHEVLSPTVTPPVPPIPPEPEPAPTGEWYNSNVNGKWNNGKARKFNDYDHELPKPYCSKFGMITAASGDPNGSIDGAGTFTLGGNGGHPRTYTDAVNYTNVVAEYDLRINQKDNNHTLQLSSRHQEGGSNDNKFGGYNYMFAIGECGLKIELFHAAAENHINGPKKSQSIIKVGEWVHVKCVLLVDVKAKRSYQSINLNNQKVVEWNATNLPDYAVDEAKFKQRSYFWNRMNPSGNATIDIKNQRLYKA